MAIKEASIPDTSPFLKWAGGKRWLVPKLLPLIGSPQGTYYEPFLGAGATFLAVDPEIKKVGSDTNSELIDTWTSIRDELQEVITELRGFKNSSEMFYEIRSWDRRAEFSSLPPSKRAARLLYLNKTCFNGLYRVNKNGQFNVPFGNYAKPNFLNIEILARAQEFLLSTDSGGHWTAELKVCDFVDATRNCSEGDVVYFDPPYEPLTRTASFTNYQGEGFSRADQETLRDVAVGLRAKGVRVILSNSSAPFIQKLYGDIEGFKISEVRSNRAISAQNRGRKSVMEFLIVGEPQ